MKVMVVTTFLSLLSYVMFTLYLGEWNPMAWDLHTRRVWICVTMPIWLVGSTIVMIQLLRDLVSPYKNEWW